MHGQLCTGLPSLIPSSVPGNYAGGIGGGYVTSQDCTIMGSTITAGKYAGGVLGSSYSTSINSTGVVDCTIGSAESLYMGGLLGGCYEGAGIQCYAVIYNSFSKDTTVIASNGAGGIAGYARRW